MVGKRMAKGVGGLALFALFVLVVYVFGHGPGSHLAMGMGLFGLVWLLGYLLIEVTFEFREALDLAPSTGTAPGGGPGPLPAPASGASYFA